MNPRRGTSVFGAAGVISRANAMLLGAGVAGLLFAWGGAFWYRHIALAHLTEQEVGIAFVLTKALADSVPSVYRALPADASAEGVSGEPVAQDDPRLHEQLARLVGARFTKLTIRRPDGRRVFSTNTAESGNERDMTAAFRQALNGIAVYETLPTDSASSRGKVAAGRQIMALYLPYRKPGSETVEAVFELHSDVTDPLAGISRAQWQIGAGLFSGTLLLAILLNPAVRRAEAILRKKGNNEHTSEQRLRYQAYYDPLTHIPNRRSFHRDLDETIRRAHQSGKSFGVMFVDLDRFKVVNDSLGHKAGDLVLQTVSQKLVSCMRRGDTVYRMGGDEFTVILGWLNDAHDAVPVARRINEVLAAPISIRQHEVAVGASIGIVVYPGDGNTADLLVRNADAAMFAAKEAGRGGFAFYTPQMNARYTERLALEAMLRKAASENEFVVYYQPRIDARTDNMIGVEALLRWRHPRLGITLPAVFIRVLEDTGLILRVGTWVLFEACRQARRWRDMGRPLRVSVNVSARQFRHERFVEVVEKALADTGVAPELLELELTESLLMDDAEQAVARMKAIRKLGVRLSIDDFGTGYSSLSYLARLSVDYLKIDQSFVVNALSNERDDAVITSTIVLARGLGMGVVAEGVEAAQQALYLRTMGCSELQGYFFGEPRPAEELNIEALPGREVAYTASDQGRHREWSECGGMRNTE